MQLRVDARVRAGDVPAAGSQPASPAPSHLGFSAAASRGTCDTRDCLAPPGRVTGASCLSFP